MVTFDDPMQKVIDIAKSLYDIDVYIQYDPAIKKVLFWGYWGETFFPDDDSIPIISLSPHLPVKHVIEILAHELAHVVVGKNVKEQHGSEWEEVFTKIHEEFMKDYKGE